MHLLANLRHGALVCATVTAACSGGGSDGAGSTLEVSLMDGPVEGVTEVHVQIDALWLKPQGGPAEELPLSAATLTLDLLELGESNAAILVDDAAIAAGTYEWLAMDVNAEFDGVYDSYVMTIAGGQEELRVPSGRVRLVSEFEVQASEAVRLLFDWDLRKGLVDPPGQPGYLLKPAFRVIDVTEYGALRGTVAATTIGAAACTGDDADSAVGNVVYVYEGADVAVDDIDEADAEPVATAKVAQNSGGDYVYRTILTPGSYTVAFTCIAGNDDPSTSDELQFTAAQNVTVSAATTVVADF